MNKIKEAFIDGLSSLLREDLGMVIFLFGVLLFFGLLIVALLTTPSPCSQ